MPKFFDPDLVHPSVTAEQIEMAHDAPLLEFPELDFQDAFDDIVRGLAMTAPNPPRVALDNAARLDDQGTDVGVGMCLYCVRGPEFGVQPLWPDAETAKAHSAPFHRLNMDTLISAPRGSVGLGTNGRHGHAWIWLGGGLVRTTDMHRLGKVDVALASRMIPWFGGIEFGWGETLNGVDVWPEHHKPKPDPAHDFHAWSRERKILFLRREAKRDRKDYPHVADHLEHWAHKLENAA